MAEDQKPGEPKKQATEANATDLLSLWGGAPSAPPQQPAAKPAPPSPVAKPVLPEPALSKPPPVFQHKPPPAPAPKAPHEPPKHEVTKHEHKPPQKEKALEGEIVNGKPKIGTALPKAGPAASPAAASEPEFLEERGGFDAQLDEFLQELNLSRRHIFYGIGCLILLIALVFGGIAGFRYYKNRTAEQTPPQRQEQAPPPAEEKISGPETAIPQTGKIGKVVPLSPETIGETGLIAAIHIGTQEGAGLTRISIYIMTFRRLQNAYATDINELLNKATDRRGRFRSYLALLRKLYEEGMKALNTIRAELEVTKASYEPEKIKQEETDIIFFEQLNALNPQTTEEILNAFIDASQKVAALRARFKALQRIETLYKEALPKLNNRIRDIELNEEALVSGIKIYDVKGSDLQLILPVSGDQPVKEEEKLSSSVIPLIPAHPSQVKTDKDFITKPGGGF